VLCSLALFSEWNLYNNSHINIRNRFNVDKTPKFSQSNLNISINIFDTENFIHQRDLVFECRFDLDTSLFFFYYVNDSLAQFGSVYPSVHYLRINYTISQNGIYILNFAIYNSSIFSYFNNTYEYRVNSFTNSESNLSPIIISLAGIGIGAMVAIPSYFSYKIYKKRQSNHQKFLSNKDFLKSKNILHESGNIEALSSIYGEKESYFANIVQSNTINWEISLNFMLLCASIAEIRIYMNQTFQLIQNFSIKNIILNKFKPKELDSLVNNILLDPINKFITIEKRDSGLLQFIKIKSSTISVVMIIQFNDLPLSEEFLDAISKFTLSVDFESVHQPISNQQFKRYLVNYFNIFISYPIYVPELDSFHSISLTKNLDEILWGQPKESYLESQKNEILHDLEGMDQKDITLVRKNMDSFEINDVSKDREEKSN
jgi:hypothetical protein